MSFDSHCFECYACSLKYHVHFVLLVCKHKAASPLDAHVKSDSRSEQCLDLSGIVEGLRYNCRITTARWTYTKAQTSDVHDDTCVTRDKRHCFSATGVLWGPVYYYVKYSTMASVPRYRGQRHSFHRRIAYLFILECACALAGPVWKQTCCFF